MIVEILVLACIALLAYKYLTTSDHSNLPPGVYGLPIIGKLPPRDRHMTYYIEDYRKKFGDIFTWKIGSRTAIILCNYNLVKQACQHPALSDRPDIFSLMSFSFGKPQGIIESNGIPWQNTRRFTIRFLKNRGMGKSSYIPEVEMEAKALVKDFENHLNKSAVLPWSVNVAVLNVTWKLAANKRFDICDGEAQTIQKIINDMFHSFQGFITVIDIMPWILHLLKGPIRKLVGLDVYEERIDKLYEYFRQVVVDARANQKPDDPPNIINAYYAEMENKESEYGSTFTETDLLVVLADIFTTGSDTTSTTIKWIISFIAKYPEVQKKMQAEIDANIPSDRFLRYDDKENLPYTCAVYQEVMRIAPLLPVNLVHSASEDTKFGKYTIPKDAMIVACTMSLHRDPKHWEKPNEFYPEHFLNKDGSLKNVTEGFIPFSIGRRSCIGEILARIQIFMMVTSLVQTYDFHEIPEEPLDLYNFHSASTLINLAIGQKVNITKRIT